LREGDFVEVVRFADDLRVVDFFDDALRPPVFFDDDFFVVDFFVDFFDDFFDGTLPPSLRASERPIAIACFLLVTFLPEPLLSVPRLRSCIAFSTLSCDFFPYLLAIEKILLHRNACKCDAGCASRFTDGR
jgi:hypothetical protein